MATKAYSLWIYDRHCTLIYHHDWSLPTASNTYSSSLPLLAPGPDLLPNVSRCVQPIIGQGHPGGGTNASSHKLPLTEHAKLIYGLVFSLRNMMGKLSTTSNAQTQSQFNTYTTPTYTLAHYQSPSSYTFVILTDPVQPPSRGLPSTGGNRSSESGSGFLPGGAAAGGGIPGTGGMSLPGVLKQIVAGPWTQWVVRNPAMSGPGGGLEYEDVEDEDEADEDGDDIDDDVPRIQSRITKGQRTRGVDSDGFRQGIEGKQTLYGIW